MFKNWNFNPTSNVYTGCYEIRDRIPAGLYKLQVSSWGEPQAIGSSLKEDVVFSFESGPMHSVLEEVRKFWDNAERYRQLGVTHKRGILLHGPAGCGKTGIVSAVIHNIIDRDGLALTINSVDSFRKAVPLFRQIEPDRKLLVVIEDIESLLEYEEEELLEVMDGASSLGNGILFLATTNYLDKVPPRIKCRPSRIDTVLEIPMPDEQLRYEYLQRICSGKFEQPELTLINWAKSTEGLSLACLKELVLSKVVYGLNTEDAIQRLKDLHEFEK